MCQVLYAVCHVPSLYDTLLKGSVMQTGLFGSLFIFHRVLRPAGMFTASSLFAHNHDQETVKWEAGRTKR